LETLNYANFSLSLHQKIEGRRIPLGGVIEVTHRCPLKCVHCFNNLPAENSQIRSRELSSEELCRVLDEIAEAGCLWLLFTGGEILVRKDFLNVFAHAKRKGLLITLFTNGVLVTEEIAAFLAGMPPFVIEITLYGRTPETYEQITRVPGSFERCMRGIRLLKDRGLPLKLKTMVVTVNKHEIWEMKRFVEEDLGLEFRFDAMINPRIDASHSPLAFRLTPEEVIGLDLQDPKRMAEWKSFTQKFNGPVHPPGKGDELYHCGAGISSFSIDPYGRLSVCVLSRGDAFDLRQGSFQEGWERFLSEVRHKKITRHTKCTGCEIKAMCGMCPANGELENQDGEEPIDFFCQVAHKRSRALGLSVKPHGECEYCRKEGAGARLP
jgi:radical SAM protein with 4Fe4S-binding SPASM domain